MPMRTRGVLQYRDMPHAAIQDTRQITSMPLSLHAHMCSGTSLRLGNGLFGRPDTPSGLMSTPTRAAGAARTPETRKRRARAVLNVDGVYFFVPVPCEAGASAGTQHGMGAGESQLQQRCRPNPNCHRTLDPNQP